MPTRARAGLWIGAVLTATAVLALIRGWVEIPPAWDPRVTLDIAAPPNLMTRYKLRRLDADGDLCRSVLQTTSMDFQKLADRSTGVACGFQDAVRVRSTPSGVGEEFSLSCRAAVSLTLWERHVVQPAAMKHFGQPVNRFEHFGSYACRNVYGRAEATRSRHATAEAWDVSGFVLQDGQRIRVARNWSDVGKSGAFLHEVHQGACRFFDGVLGPDYNQAHHDHLHLDRGPFRLCR